MGGDGGGGKYPQLEKWGSVAEIREYYRRNLANLRDIAQEERNQLVAACEAEVEAYKLERRARRMDRERRRNREVARERRAGNTTEGVTA